MKAICKVLKKASLAGAFFVLGGFALAQADGCARPSVGPSLRVDRVVDGDTLRLVDGRSLRLIGINAPELRPRGRTAEPYAQRAQNRLQALIAANGGRVSLYPAKPEQDRYGRSLVHLFDAQGRNIESQLLEEGLGYFVAFAPASDLATCQLAAERRARQQRLGLWGREQVSAPSQLRRSGFSLLRGRITSVERNAAGVWLELDGAMVVRIEARKARQFAALLGQRLEGRQVQVRGWVVDRYQRSSNRSYQRWLLTLSDPLMIQLEN